MRKNESKVCRDPKGRIYTHVGIDALSGEVQVGTNKNYVVYAYDREADIVA